MIRYKELRLYADLAAERPLAAEKSGRKIAVEIKVMDRLNAYRQIVQKLLSKHAELAPDHGQIESTPVFDERNDHYLLVDYGWDRTGRAYSVAVHVRLKDGKIWIERDGTEGGVAEELVQAGVPKEDIVLGFYRPERRRISEFAAL